MVRLHEPKTVCSFCQGEGHTKISCIYKKDAENDDDRLLRSMIATYETG